MRSCCGPRTCGWAYEHSEVLPRATARLHSRQMTRAASSCTRLPVFALLKFPLSWECAHGPRGRMNGRAHSDLHLCACAWPLDDVVTHGFSATSTCASTHASARVVCERHVRRWTSGYVAQAAMRAFQVHSRSCARRAHAVLSVQVLRRSCAFLLSS